MNGQNIVSGGSDLDGDAVLLCWWAGTVESRYEGKLGEVLSCLATL